MAEPENLDDALRRTARRAIFKNALMRWESATLIAVTLVGFAFLSLAALIGLVSWLWPLAAVVAGSVAWAGVFASSLTDEKDNARAVAEALRNRYAPKNLRSVKLRQELTKAWQYRDMLTQTIERTRQNVLRDRLYRAVELVDEWIEQIYGLATRIDNYEQNAVIRQDMQAVPKALKKLENQLHLEKSADAQETLRRTISDKERQWQQLKDLQSMMEQANYQLQGTLAMLGTICAQLQAIDLKGTERGQDEDLRVEIDEQVHQLQDLSEAMDEVYQSQSMRAG